MMDRIRSFVVHTLLFVMTVLSIGLPATSTASVTVWMIPAPTGAAAGTWSAHASNTGNWIGYAGGSQLVPRDNWKPLGNAVWDKSGGFDMNMIHGERWITMARADAGGIGLSSKEISDRMQRFPANSTYVFAAYSPESAEMRIEVHRIEKRPDGNIYIEQADFTPWHGEKWKAAGKYRNATEVGLGSDGYNPFESFKGASVDDSLFHNIGWSGVQVAVGHAMRHYGAMLGFIAVSRSRTAQDVKTKGSILKKTTTVTVKGWVKPEWYIATPVEMQQEGAMTSSICVSSVAQTATTAACDDPAHVAISGVAVTQWKGGNMPADEDLVYQWVQKKSAFTMLFFTLVLGLVTWGLATALTGAAGLTTTAAAGGAGTSFAGGAYGLAAGLSHAVLSNVMHGGSLMSAQSNFFGETGNGVIQVNLGSMSVQSQGLAQGVRNKHIKSAQGYNLTGAQKLFKGSCPESKTVAECWGLGLDAGQMWRGDAYQEVNMTLEMRSKYDECKGLGLSGAALMQCAAPNATSWPSP